MVSVAIAITCLVGIPFVIGLFVATLFWSKLNNRLNKEIEDTKDLEEELQKENDYFEYDNINTWKMETQLPKIVKQPDIDNQQSINDLDNVSKAYIPAYKKKFEKRLYELKKRNSSINLTSGTSSQETSTCTTSLGKRISIYENILPVLETSGSTVEFARELGSSGDEIQVTDHDSKRRSILLGRSLAKQDLGAYYPHQ